MSTTLQDRRLEQRFALWDANHDGKIDITDYEAEARRLLRAFDEPEHSPRAQAVIAAYRGMFLYGAHEAGIAENDALTPEQFMRISTETLIDRGDEGFAQVLRPCIRAVADLCDEDGDGQVNPEEFDRWIRAIGAEGNPREMFAMIDKNGDGQLTVDELVAAVRDYHAGRLQIPLLGA